MEQLKDYTPTELLKFVNDYNRQQTEIKDEIYGLLDQIKELDEKINEKVSKLDHVEGMYVKIMEELSSRGK